MEITDEVSAEITGADLFPAVYDLFWIGMVAVGIVLVVTAIVMVHRSSFTGMAEILLMLAAIMFPVVGSILAIVLARERRRALPAPVPGAPNTEAAAPERATPAA